MPENQQISRTSFGASCIIIKACLHVKHNIHVHKLTHTNTVIYTTSQGGQIYIFQGAKCNFQKTKKQQRLKQVIKDPTKFWQVY